MTQTVTVSSPIRFPVEEAGAFVTDPRQLFPQLSTFSRCRFIEARDDGELWNVYLNTGTIYLGGRVLITPTDGTRLRWHSVRGTRHSFDARVDPDGDGSKLTISLTFSASGWGIARLSELIGRGLVTRNLEAATQEIRHHLEYER